MNHVAAEGHESVQAERNGSMRAQHGVLRVLRTAADDTVKVNVQLIREQLPAGRVQVFTRRRAE